MTLRKVSFSECVLHFPTSDSFKIEQRLFGQAPRSCALGPPPGAYLQK